MELEDKLSAGWCGLAGLRAQWPSGCGAQPGWTPRAKQAAHFRLAPTTNFKQHVYLSAGLTVTAPRSRVQTPSFRSIFSRLLRQGVGSTEQGSHLIPLPAHPSSPRVCLSIAQPLSVSLPPSVLAAYKNGARIPPHALQIRRMQKKKKKKRAINFQRPKRTLSSCYASIGPAY